MLTDTHKEALKGFAKAKGAETLSSLEKEVKSQIKWYTTYAEVLAVLTVTIFGTVAVAGIFGLLKLFGVM